MERRIAKGVWVGFLAGLMALAGVGGTVGCGGGDDGRPSAEAESGPRGVQGAQEGEGVSCDRPLRGTVAASDAVREETDIGSYRYILESERRLRLEVRGDDRAPIGELELQFDGSVSRQARVGMVATYDREGAQSVAMALSFSSLSSETPERSRFQVEASYVHEERTYEFLSIFGLNAGVEQENPVTLETMRVAADGFEGQPGEAVRRVQTLAGERWVLPIVEDDAAASEASIEAWAVGSGFDEAVGDELREMLGVLLDRGWAESLEEQVRACAPDYRAGNERLISKGQAAEPVCQSREQHEEEKEEAETAVFLGNTIFGLGVGSLVTGAGTFLAGAAASYGIISLSAEISIVILTVTGVTASGVVLLGIGLVVIGLLAMAVGLQMRDENSNDIRDADRALQACGNPAHFSSDGLAYDFPFAGDYIWLEATDGHRFAVHLRQEPNRASKCAGGAAITGAAARVGGHRVNVYAAEERDEQLWIDGEPADASQYVWELGEAGYVEDVYAPAVGQRSLRMVWATGERLRVEIFERSGRLDVEMEHLPAARRGKVHGLAGNLNGDPDDDVRLRDGGVLEVPVDWEDFAGRFAESWRVGESETLFEGAEAVPGTQTGGKPSENPVPGTLEELSDAQIGAARARCRSRGVEDAALLRFCVRDVACTGDGEYADSFVDVGPPLRELKIRLPDGRVYPDEATRERLMTVPEPDVEPLNLHRTRRLPNCGESTGDPHQRSFDGLKFSLQAAGEFVMAEARVGEPWVVQARFEPVVGGICPHVTFHTAVATVAGDHRVAFYARRPEPVWVDGRPVDILGGETPLGDGVSLRQAGTFSWVVSWPGGEILNVRKSGGHLNLNIVMPDRRRGQIQGVLGRFNADRSDDIVLRDGTVLEQPVAWERMYAEFAESWRVTPAESLFDYEPGEGTETFTDRSVPGRPTTIEDLPAAVREAARQSCEEGGVTDEEILRDCILDVGCTSDASYVDSHADREAPEERLEVAQPVFLDGWSQEGPPGNGVWEVAEDGRSVLQRTNGNPTFFVSQRDYIGTTIRGTFGVDGGDDDFIGFVFGYQKPLTANGDDPRDPNFLLLSWKRSNQGRASEGLTLSHVTTWTRTRDFWDQVSQPGYRVLRRDYGDDRGWEHRETYEFELTYTAEAVEVVVDGRVVFAVSSAEFGGPFPSGRFGFYNYSQAGVTYGGFSATPSPAPTRTVRVPAQGTYLRVDAADRPDDRLRGGAWSAAPVDLALRGIEPGDTIRLRRLGAFETDEAAGNARRQAFGMLGVFSRSAELGDAQSQSRVSGAVDVAGAGEVVTGPTATGGEPTDIAEDFRIAEDASGEQGGVDRVIVTVPAGARYLFVAPAPTGDGAWGDNTDEDGDFEVIIEEL